MQLHLHIRNGRIDFQNAHEHINSTYPIKNILANNLATRTMQYYSFVISARENLVSAHTHTQNTQHWHTLCVFFFFYLCSFCLLISHSQCLTELVSDRLLIYELFSFISYQIRLFAIIFFAVAHTLFGCCVDPPTPTIVSNVLAFYLFYRSNLIDACALCVLEDSESMYDWRGFYARLATFLFICLWKSKSFLLDQQNKNVFL